MIAPVFAIVRRRLRVRFGLSDEAIPATMSGFNEAWSFGVIPQNFAQLTNDNFEGAVTNKGSRPDGLEKFVFCDQLARTPKQVIQYCKGFRSEFDGL